jgi:diguanylate cyclase (GGDEF)-like protein/PAS domain S-box-containing protein
MWVNRLKYVALCCSLAIVYMLAARLGLTLAFEQANTSPVWPPTGIAIAACLYFGCRAWPGILAGAVIGNLSVGTPVAAAFTIAMGNTLEALFACYLINRYLQGDLFSRIINTLLFVVFVALASTISATVGISSLLLEGVVTAGAFGQLWKTWWLGDVVGGIVIAPLLLTWSHIPLAGVSRWKLLEAVGLTGLTLVLSVLIFGDDGWSVGGRHFLILIIPLLLVWAALRFHYHGATLLITICSAAAVIGTLAGQGPFVMATDNESLLFLQASVGAAMVTALILVASQEERLLANRQLQLARKSLESQVNIRTRELHATNHQLEQEIVRQQHLSKTLQALLNATEQASSQQIFYSCVRDLADAYKACYAFIGTYADSGRDSMNTLAVWAADRIVDNFSYALAGSPCEDVLNLAMEWIPRDAALRYPNDRLLQDMGVESYFGAPLKSSTGEVIGIIAVMDTRPMFMEDWVKPVLGLFSQRVALELERRSSQDELELAASVFKESVEAIVIYTADTRILRVNPAFTRITGYSADEAIGQKSGFLHSGMQSQAFYESFWRSLNDTGNWQGEIINRRKDGEVFPAWLTITSVRSSAGEIQQYISIFNDITEKKLSEQRIYDLAHNDIVTGLPNRVAFHEQISTELDHARRNRTQLAVMFIDLDHFKLINDTSGHPMGDLLLQQVAQRLKGSIRQSDAVSRFGGDEFTVLLPNIESSDEAGIVANKILQGLAKPFCLEGNEVTTSASIGIGIYPQNGEDASTLLKNADSAMYRAKEQGRSSFRFFTEEMNRHALERMELEQDLRRALERHEFLLHYQPQVDIFSGRIVGCEALIRWQHPLQGLVPPDRFIPVAEATGLIVPIGEWVLNTALQQHKAWRHMVAGPLIMSVNLSSRQFMQKELLQTIKNALDSSGVVASELELEFTESMMMANVDDTVSTLESIREHGIRLAIDDFGTGYSSLSYLKRFPINKLKIDRSFVEGLPEDADDAAIVKATIAIAHALNLTIIAEGVETREQLEFLKVLCCEEVQGYYFSRPLPANELMGLLGQGFDGTVG